MNDSLDALRRRRAILLARSGVLRHRLGAQALVLHQPLVLAERAQGALRWAREHPLGVAAAAAVGLVLRPRRTLAWSARLWAGWRLWRRVRDLLVQRD